MQEFKLPAIKETWYRLALKTFRILLFVKISSNRTHDAQWKHERLQSIFVLSEMYAFHFCAKTFETA